MPQTPTRVPARADKPPVAPKTDCRQNGHAPPVISGAQAVRAFAKAGWTKDRQRGSYLVTLMAGRNVSLSIPQHRELAPGTLRAPIRAAGMTVDEFVALR